MSEVLSHTVVTVVAEGQPSAVRSSGRLRALDGRPACGRRSALAFPLVAAFLLLAGFPGTGWSQDTLPEGKLQVEEGVESARYGAFTFLKRPVEESGSMMTVLLAPEIGSTAESGVRLFFRCMASKPEIYLAATDTTLGPPEASARGQFRFDRGRWSQLADWPTDESGQAVFLPGLMLGRFVQRALDAERLYVQLAGDQGSFRQSVFSLDGFSEGAPRLPCFRGALPE